MRVTHPYGRLTETATVCRYSFSAEKAIAYGIQ